MVQQDVRVHKTHVHIRHHTVFQVRAKHVLPDPFVGRHGGRRERDAPDGQRHQIRSTVVRGHGHGGRQ